MSDLMEVSKGCVLKSDSKNPDYLRILKMANELEFSCSAIASGFGLAKTTVNDFLRRFKDSGLAYPLEPGITNLNSRLNYH